MPSYEYEHTNETCNEEWEEWRSINDCFPKNGNIKCPKCGAVDNIVLLVSGGSGKGKVILQGREAIEQNKIDTDQLRREVYSNENLYSNLVGESRYEGIQKQMDKNKRR